MFTTGGGWLLEKMYARYLSISGEVWADLSISPAFFRAFGSWPLSESLRHCASCRRGSSWGCHAILECGLLRSAGKV